MNTLTRRFSGPLLGFSLLATLGASAHAQTAGDWATYNGPLRGTRFSPLREINTANVSRLRPVARFDLGVTTSFQTGPVVIGGTMFLTTATRTYAIDGATGRKKWQYDGPAVKSGTGTNRGVAYADGRVFRGQSDGSVVALDAASGRRVWSVPIADIKRGESVPMAPMAWKGMVFVGNAGGDIFGVTGRIYALDARTGQQMWRFDTVPKSGPASETWLRKSPTNPPTGGTNWTTLSLDPDSGALYVATGNPAPDYAAYLHPGRSLYTTCLVALDARSGRLLSYIQPTPDDFHDWDVGAAPALITTRGGRQLAATGGKDGFLHGIDVSQVNRAVAQGALTRPQPGGIDGAAGPNSMRTRFKTPVTRRFNTRAHFNSRTFTRFAPGSQGGVEWNGPSYYAPLNLVVVPAIDWASLVKLAPPAKASRGTIGKPWTGAFDGGFAHQDPKSKWGGFVTALDADSGRIKWKARIPTPSVGALTTTAGGLAFSGDLNGDLRAFDVKSGRILWSHHSGKPIGGGIVSYSAGGRQYLAVAEGLSAPIWPTKPTPARIVIYRLP